jgi:hypothetical protein
MLAVEVVPDPAENCNLEPHAIWSRKGLEIQGEFEA